MSNTRIYVPHKITIALKFMSYINSDLLIPPSIATIHKVGPTAWTRVVSHVLNVMNNSTKIKST